MSRYETVDMRLVSVSFNVEEGLVIEHENGAIMLDATRNDLLAAIGAAVEVPAAFAALTGGSDRRECSQCGDEVLTLSTDHLCDGCVAANEGTVICPNCGERVDEDDMNHWPNLAKPISMCSSCEHDARRSGWEPGQ